jgi:hypothetical protein
LSAILLKSNQNKSAKIFIASLIVLIIVTNADFFLLAPGFSRALPDQCPAFQDCRVAHRNITILPAIQLLIKVQFLIVSFLVLAILVLDEDKTITKTNH